MEARCRFWPAPRGHLRSHAGAGQGVRRCAHDGSVASNRAAGRSPGPARRLGEKVKALLDANDLDRGEPEEIAPPGQTTELVVEVEDPVTPLLARLAAAAQEKEPDDRGAQGAEDQRTGNAAQTERLESEKALAEIQGRQTQDLEEQLASINEQYTEGHQNDSLEEKAADAAKLEEAAQLARAELADRQAAEQERERAAREAAAPTAPTPDRGM